MADPIWIGLVVKVVLSVAVVILGSLAAERAGPLVGGVIGALPMSAGPAYVVMALQTDDRFIADGAVGSLVAIIATTVFLVVLARLIARFGLWLSLAAGLAGWLAAASLLRPMTWSGPGAMIANIVAFGIAARLIGPRLTEVPPPSVIIDERPRLDLLLRGLLVGVLVVAVVVGSRFLGPATIGMAAVFPINLTSLVLLIHPRLGGPATAATMVGALRAIPGLALALLALHWGAVPLGAPTAMVLALAICLLWSFGLLAWNARPLARGTV
ncbi:MAG TPA: hypothetical protein VNT30_09750 [Stellaceae bacterium]|nr:hypothetical protein [Stellaceae bacterium]